MSCTGVCGVEVVPPAGAFVLPATYQQEREFLASRRRIAHTNNVIILRALGRLNVDAVRKAIGLLVARHEALRTHLAEAGGEVVQVVHCRATIDVMHADARNSRRRRSRALAAAIRGLAAEPFELRRAPLLRTGIVRLGSTESVICLVLPHTIFDARTLDVICEDLRDGYLALAVGDPPALCPLNVQLGDFAQSQRAAANSSDTQYWHEQLRGASGRLSLACHRRRGSDGRFLGEFAVIPQVSGRLGSELSAVASAAHATLPMALSAVLSVLLRYLVATDEIVFGVSHANRDHARELDRVVGCLVDVLPLRINVCARTPFRSVVAHVARVTSAAYAHRVPGAPLIERIGGVDVSLNVRVACDSRRWVAAGMTFEASTPLEYVRCFPTKQLWWGAQLGVSLDLREDCSFDGDICFNSAVVSREAATEFARRFSAIASLAALRPGATAAQLSRQAERLAASTTPPQV